MRKETNVVLIAGSAITAPVNRSAAARTVQSLRLVGYAELSITVPLHHL